MTKYIDANELLKFPIDTARKPSMYIKYAPTVDAIPFPDNATNGDIIKALFPNVEFNVVRKLSGCDYVEARLDGFNKQCFELDWWNALYTEEDEFHSKHCLVQPTVPPMPKQGLTK